MSCVWGEGGGVWKNEAGKQVKRSAAGMVVNTRRCAARPGGSKRWPCAKGSGGSANEVWYDKRHTRETSHNGGKHLWQKATLARVSREKPA